MQALQAATSKAANHLQLDDLGLLQSGYSADFVILDANPLEDIRNTRSIIDVYLKGKPVDRAVLQQQWQGQ
jgi:imidazolonepropionase-like amidohydrolase